ncbi:hypothetical protein PCE1_003917 [Barthelona sp. PCE]
MSEIVLFSSPLSSKMNFDTGGSGENYRQVGKLSDGNLIKGNSYRIASAPSIPSKFVTILHHQDRKKGFSISSKRFNSKKDVENRPGPGTYRVRRDSFEATKPSYSKQGIGNFASKGNRFNTLKRGAMPGPGSYNIPGSFQKTTKKEFKPKQKFRRKVGRTIKKESDDFSVGKDFVNVRQKSTRLLPKRDKKKVPFGYSAPRFKEKETNDVPGPGQYGSLQYGYENMLFERKKKKQNQKKNREEPIQKKMKNFLVSKKVKKKDCGPGPGDYEIDVQRNTRSYRSSFVPTLHNRFGKLMDYYGEEYLDENEATPGPGAYFKMPRVQKKYTDSSIFKSNQTRDTMTPRSTTPGPGYYHKELSHKTSFHVKTKQWL